MGKDKVEVDEALAYAKRFSELEDRVLRLERVLDKLLYHTHADGKVVIPMVGG